MMKSMKNLLKNFLRTSASTSDVTSEHSVLQFISRKVVQVQ